MALKFQRPTADDVGLDASRRRGILFVVLMAVVMWIAEIVDAAPIPDPSGLNLDRYGIEPRDTGGLDGIILAPFLHGGFGHLIGNTIPFIMLGVTIALSGLARVVAVTVIVALVSGLGTWTIAPANTVHIGASGVVFGYATYLVARWLYTRQLMHLAMGVVVAVVWGATLLGGLVPTPGVSWQAHLFGALGGFIAAATLDGRDRRRSTAARASSPSAFVRG